MAELRFFKMTEFDCKCGCGSNRMLGAFLWKLDLCRERCKFRFDVTSGYRCEKHNAAVGGKKKSEHLSGRGVDIATHNSRERYKIVEEAIELGINRIGIGSDFVHLGYDKSKVQMVIWVY